ncbi:hypothetical protein HF086_002884 [Spodoptera exigua]|uniref:HTH psq-type domain-containing protein n=1 Tax=Spodoptera exigua TaxID=7107 RepID=A0A922M8Q5_SPOEX|nr:hypothetical protein HF086_002884 [Spodoptera exigua]
MPLLDYKLLLAEALTRANQAFYTPTRNRRRPAAEEPKRKRKRRIDLPLPEIANDGLDHLPAYTQERQLCKIHGCSEEAMEKAMEAVSRGATASAAAREFCVPRTTLLDKVTGRNAIDI